LAFTDTWLAVYDWRWRRSRPNSLPVEEWSIHINEKSQLVYSSGARGGAANGPAAVFTVTKTIESGVVDRIMQNREFSNANTQMRKRAILA
jgi:hypothetical protein